MLAVDLTQVARCNSMMELNLKGYDRAKNLILSNGLVLNENKLRVGILFILSGDLVWVDMINYWGSCWILL